jgi:hypothetical protein
MTQNTVTRPVLASKYNQDRWKDLHGEIESQENVFGPERRAQRSGGKQRLIGERELQYSSLLLPLLHSTNAPYDV